jgi:AraC-like DNA-binding protein
MIPSKNKLVNSIVTVLKIGIAFLCNMSLSIFKSCFIKE